MATVKSLEDRANDAWWTANDYVVENPKCDSGELWDIVELWPKHFEDRLHGRCSLAAMMSFDMDIEVEKLESDVKRLTEVV